MLLVTVIIYVYAMIVAEFYKNQFTDEIREYNDLQFKVDICETYLSCFMYILNMGLRYGGGIAEVMYIGEKETGEKF